MELFVFEVFSIVFLSDMLDYFSISLCLALPLRNIRIIVPNSILDIELIKCKNPMLLALKLSKFIKI